MMLFSELLKKKQHVILPTANRCQLHRLQPILVLTNALLLRGKEHKCINCTMHSCFKSFNWLLCTTGLSAECMQLERYQCYKQHSSQWPIQKQQKHDHSKTTLWHSPHSSPFSLSFKHLDCLTISHKQLLKNCFKIATRIESRTIIMALTMHLGAVLC